MKLHSTSVNVRQPSQRALALATAAFFFTVLPAHAETADQQDKRLSEDIVVTARVQGYDAKDASSATRTNTPLLETPQSVTVLPRDLIEDLSGTRVEDVLDYAGGFVRGNNFGGSQMAGYTLRGFTTSEYFRNGFPFNRGITGTPDSITVERLDVLRGPAALLYGRGDPGGTFNIVTRRPEATAGYDLTARINSYGALRGAASATGALTGDGALRYRLSAAVEDGGTHRDHVENNRYVIAPVIAWNPGENTTITLDTEFMQADSTFDRGVPSFPGQIEPFLPASRFFSEPSLKPWRTYSGVGQLRIDHRLGGDWILSGGMQYYKVRVKGPGVEFSALRPDRRSITRNYSERQLDTSVLDVQANLTGTLKTGAIEHTLLFGLEYEKFRNSFWINRSRPASDPFAIDLLAPVYGQPLPPIYRASDSLSKAKAYAAYAQDQISLTAWLKLLAGFRVEKYDSYSGNGINNTSSAFKQTVVTPRFGVVILPTRNFSIYGSFAKSNKPNTAFDRFGNVLDPERGVSYEAGVKLDLFEGALSFTTALFHTVKQNVSTSDPDDPTNTYSIAAGEVRSRGVDVTIAGELVKGLRVSGGYSYADSEVTKDNRLPIGTRLANAPRETASMLAVYEFQDGPLKGLGLGTGVNHIGKRMLSTSATSPSIPGYTVVNLIGYYDLNEKIRFQVNVNNVFDKYYIERTFGTSSLAPGAPLNAVFTVTAKF